MTNNELSGRLRENEEAQEILTKKIERLERALRALVGTDQVTANVATTPFVSINEGRSILDETFPI